MAAGLRPLPDEARRRRRVPESAARCAAQRRARRNAPVGAGEQCATGLSPGDDIESPLCRTDREAGVAARGVRFTAVTAVHRIEVILRADRVVVVERAVVGHSERRRHLEDLARQQVQVVEVQTRGSQAPQQRHQRGQLGRQRVVRGEPGSRQVQLHRVAASRLEVDDVTTIGQQPRELIHVAPHAPAPGMRDENDQRTIRGEQTRELGARMNGSREGGGQGR